MWYFLFMVCIIMPLNGHLVVNVNPWLGSLLILMQVPYLYNIAKEIEGKDCVKIFK